MGRARSALASPHHLMELDCDLSCDLMDGDGPGAPFQILQDLS